MSLSLKRKLLKLEVGWFGAVSDPPTGPVMLGWPFVLIDPCEYAAAVGLTPAQYCAPLARLAVIDAEPPTWISVFVNGGRPPPALDARFGDRPRLHVQHLVAGDDGLRRGEGQEGDGQRRDQAHDDQRQRQRDTVL